jgi:(p)ppGpp synthase/HD superfamily hydrolase
MELLIEAFQLAAELHSQQYKTGSGVTTQLPSLSHLMEVAGMVLANGGDEVACAAALLHDSIENIGGHSREVIRERLGEPVLSIVEECTESATSSSSPWKERKRDYLQQISTASLPALLVMTADKLQNSRVLVRRLKLKGSQGWGRADRESKLWFKQQLLHSMEDRLGQLEQESNQAMVKGTRLLLAEYADTVHVLMRS